MSASRVITIIVVAFMNLLLVPGTLRAADANPEDLLKEKGFVKQGALYLLKDEQEMGETMRKFRLTKKTYDDDLKKRLECEGKIKMAKSYLAQWEFQGRELNEKLAKIDRSDAFENNRIVGQLNVLQSKMKEGSEFVAAREADLKKYNESREAYINATIETSAKLEKTTAKYDELGKDADVKAALDKVNEKAKPKMKLGPGPELATNLAFVKKLRGDISSAVVKVTYEHRVPEVEVTLNGAVTRSMIVDSGASIVSITAPLAKELGLNPLPQDPVLRMRLADGKLVEARQMVLKSVRVGQFTIENVECAVLPESLVAAENLLGGSFLKHFVYKLDPEAAELHLNQVGGKKETTTPPPKK